ncbi:hypothetical protein MCEREM3_01375 [Methylophilaceae bacterium]
MPPNTKIDFSDAHQDRSKKTLEDLLEAAYHIVDAADPTAFNSRNLADKSGYALGTLNKRLGPVENVFLWAIEKGRDSKIQSVIDYIDQFNAHSTIQEYAEHIVDMTFKGIGIVGPKVIRYYEAKLFKRDGVTADSINFSDVFIKSHLKLVDANQTNTFRKMTQNEASLILRLTQHLIERPFVNGDAIAGTIEHRRIAIETMIRLLGK